jgi:hypothetical protein
LFFLSGINFGLVGTHLPIVSHSCRKSVTVHGIETSEPILHRSLLRFRSGEWVIGESLLRKGRLDRYSKATQCSMREVCERGGGLANIISCSV